MNEAKITCKIVYSCDMCDRLEGNSGDLYWPSKRGTLIEKE